MSLLRFDSIGGASGNMILGALVNAGADLAGIEAALATLPLQGYRIERTDTVRDGLSGLHLDVVLDGHANDHGKAAHTTHADHAEHSTDPHHHHKQSDDPHHHHAVATEPHNNSERHLPEIEAVIRSGALSERARELSLAVFRKLAEAEAAIHGTTVNEIHFHEVGAVDAIVDIVGSCVALDGLHVRAVRVGPLPMGQGETTCAHGVMPIPVPAVVRLLQGHPVRQTEEPFELVTPTGAALLMTWKELLPAGGSELEWTPVSAGYGFGTRTLRHRTNVLRVTVMETGTATTAGDDCLVLECNLDDATAEVIGALTQRLLEQGALDVFTTAVQMKKQRPGTLLTVLCTPDRRALMIETLFLEGTTFGVREYVTRRTQLARRIEEVVTPYGNVRIKVGQWQGREVTRAPEFDDCLARARAAGVPLREVYAAAQRATGSPLLSPPPNV